MELVAIARRVGGGGLVAALPEMEMCEIAAALGVHDAEDVPPAGNRAGVPSAGGRRRNLIRERMLHAQDPERYPAPQPDAPDPATRQFVAEFGGLASG